jgi:L-aspartate oxidase
MECLVFARQLRHINLSEPIRDLQTSPDSAPSGSFALPGDSPSPHELTQQIHSLRQLCWQAAGVERQGHNLAAALQQVRRQRHQLEASEAWQHLAARPAGQTWDGGSATDWLKLAYELHHRLSLADLLMEASLFREESRGGHFRTDCPAKQPFWQRHSVQTRQRPIATAPLSL